MFEAFIAVSVYQGIFIITLAFVATTWRRYRKVVSVLGNIPGYRGFSVLPGFVHSDFAKIPGLTIHSNFVQRDKHSRFEAFGWDIISQAFAWPSASSNMLIADAEALQLICNSRSKFPKPVERYKVVTCFGDNIIAAEGEVWKRHRKVTQSAFSERNNKLVWDETCRIMSEIFHAWGDGDRMVQHAVDDLTFPIALLVICGAGFGRRISWGLTGEIPAGHTMSFFDAVGRLGSDLFLRVLIPRWAMPFRERWRRFQSAYDEFSVYMLDMIKEKRKENDSSNDLFYNLLHHEADVSSGLEESEVIGNVFILLLAGHETTAHTLAFALALLATHPEEQDKLYEQVSRVMGDTAIPSYTQYSQLNYALAVFNETLRMFPPVGAIPKLCTEDTVFYIHRAVKDGDRVPDKDEAEDRLAVSVKKGTQVRMCIAGLHYNPRYWKKPHEFNPERFMDPNWPREAFIPFSDGARSCLGRRFFETEGVAILCALINRYKVEPVPGCSKDDLLGSKVGLTLTPTRVPLVFKRRT